MHPVTLLAVAVLVINDWVLKPRWQGLVTGKLSDIAGLIFAPVVLSAAIGLVLAAAVRLGAPIDPSLSRRRLLACIIATGAGFVAVKLSPTVAATVAHALAYLGRPASFSADRTDLWTLPALAIAWWIGSDELRRTPLGKPAALHRLGRAATSEITDPELAAAIDAWDVAQIDALLARPHP
jgi:hypothetical protein